MEVSFFHEQDLLKAIAAGDTDAFSIIYNKYYVSIYSYANRLLKSEILAEEVVQEVFLKIWRMEQKLTAIQQLEPFLITVSRNLALDYLRRQDIQKQVVYGLQTQSAQSANTTEEQVILNETRRILDQAISRLPPQQKLAYELCHQEGLRYEDAAQKMKLSAETVKSYMKLALASIRKFVTSHTDISVLLIIFKLL